MYFACNLKTLIKVAVVSAAIGAGAAIKVVKKIEKKKNDFLN